MGKSKPKKKGGMGYVLVVLLVALIMLPASANRSFAGDFTAAFGDVPMQVTAGYTLIAGPSDPGEAGALTLNSILGVINSNLTIPGVSIAYRGTEIAKLGILSGGYSGPAGSDLTAKDNGRFFLSAGASVLGGLHGNAMYVLDSRAESNWGVYASVEPAKVGPVAAKLIGTMWSKTGL